MAKTEVHKKNSTTDLIPSSQVKIPATYIAAKAALEKCVKVDECKDWADKAAALASYAKQRDDKELHLMATRIRARAILRIGQLLKEIPPIPGKRTDKEPSMGGQARLSRLDAATNAGLSKYQKNTAIQVANVPAADFEAAVESEEPATAEKLAKMGKKPRPLVDLQGRDPKEFALSTQAQARLREMAAFALKTSPGAVSRGAFDKERMEMIKAMVRIRLWMGFLRAHIIKVVKVKKGR